MLSMQYELGWFLITAGVGWWDVLFYQVGCQEASELPPKLCGKARPEPLAFNCSVIMLVFISDHSSTFAGFRLQYKTSHATSTGSHNAVFDVSSMDSDGVNTDSWSYKVSTCSCEPLHKIWMKTIALAILKMFHGCKILNKSGHVTLDHAPFRGNLSSAGWDMLCNVPTTFEVRSVTLYRDMKGVAKCTKWGDLEWLGVTQGYQQCHSSIERIWFPISLPLKVCLYLVPFSRY